MNKSVLVIGGGVSGIQASIDLGDMGFKVYLVEKSPSVRRRKDPVMAEMCRGIASVIQRTMTAIKVEATTA